VVNFFGPFTMDKRPNNSVRKLLCAEDMALAIPIPAHRRKRLCSRKAAVEAGRIGWSDEIAGNSDKPIQFPRLRLVPEQFPQKRRVNPI
jgi:hypothetical protein